MARTLAITASFPPQDRFLVLCLVYFLKMSFYLLGMGGLHSSSPSIVFPSFSRSSPGPFLKFIPLPLLADS